MKLLRLYSPAHRPAASRVNIFGRIRERLKSRRLRRAQETSRSPQEYWERRTRLLGRRAVFNASHSDADLERVTDAQKDALYPHLQSRLRGHERVVLDLGCGPGRFSADLADLVGGRTIGLDTTRALLELAPPSSRVEYRQMPEGRIPLPDSSVDLVWIVLVLGGITQHEVLSQTVAETRRVLADGGLLFLAENTSDKPDTDHWSYRSVDAYVHLFPEFQLRHVDDYFDLDDRISVLIGRKPEPQAPSG
jgi:SAM-dependent methyltransferase